jgi:antitoxin component of MazEF toxin-antitoxin module
MMDDKIRFRRKIGKSGDSIMITIPPELVEFLNIQQGQDLTMTAETGKKGKFMAVFVE